MKKSTLIIIVILLAAVVAAGIFIFAKVGPKDNSKQGIDSDTVKVVMCGDCNSIDDGGFNEVTWNSIENVCDDNGIGCAYFLPESDKKKALDKCVEEAVNVGAELIVLNGSDFEETAFDMQKKFEDVKFILVDGIPHDKDNNYSTGKNSVGVMFAEEEAGYMAGYAAVVEGYMNLGFMGGKSLPSVKRYGYGFIQGAAAAAAQTKTEGITIKYKYEETFEATNEVKKDAGDWYKDGVQVIFACGGGMGKAVMKAAENNQGLVIGVDVDQSGESSTVIASAEKRLDTAVTDVIKDYLRDSFPGGSVFTYNSANDGVALDSAGMKKFNDGAYKKLFNRIANGKVKLKKDKDVKSVEGLGSDNVKVDYIK